MNGSAFFARVAGEKPFSSMHPVVGAFFKDYLSHEKVIMFDGRQVVNTHFPPFPGRSFDNLAEQFSSIGETEKRKLYSVTMAVTNRCGYRCRHCYNAGREQHDLPLASWAKIARQLCDLSAVTITLSGGEPLLRKDLEGIIRLFDDRSSVVLNTTGHGFDRSRASALKDAGLFGAGISLDSLDPAIHDLQRGVIGAFDTAVKAVGTARECGLYAYVIAVASRELLEPSAFERFMRFAGSIGAYEVHLLEPCPVGNLKGETEALLDIGDVERIFDYQEMVSKREDLPILSSFAYIESPKAFGCGAGITHLYIDGTGEVCPCNFVPCSFGNADKEPLTDILDRMSEHFGTPRTSCIGHVLAGHIPEGACPTPPDVSLTICRECLPANHDVPAFFTLKKKTAARVGARELKEAYDGVSGDYDEFWVSEAGKPVIDLIDRLHIAGYERVFEAGCGTGFASEHIVQRLEDAGHFIGADISEGMLEKAMRRPEIRTRNNAIFIAGDACEKMRQTGPFDIVFSSWVLGYIPMKAFFSATAESLKDKGRLAFIVHKENSPARELGIFTELVAENPGVLTKQVSFDFPRDKNHLEEELTIAGLRSRFIIEGAVVFRYDSTEKVLEHLLKSGAGTAFYQAVIAEKRAELEKRFLEWLSRDRPPYDVAHDYLMCIAEK